MFKNLTLAALMISLAAFFNTGCATKQGTGTAVGTGAGAAVGAGIGALIGGKKGALIGGAVGAVTGGATGAAIGSYMDKQKKEIEEKVANADVQKVGEDLVVRFPSGMLFDLGKADLKAASQGDLNDFANVLTQYPATKITVEGHTDSTGPKDLNMRLSNSRAKSVSNYLFGKGVDQARMSTMGYADERPVMDNATAAGRAANRRVEVKIVADPTQVPANG